MSMNMRPPRVVGFLSEVGSGAQSDAMVRAMTNTVPAPAPLPSAKFRDPRITARGERRATVALKALATVWFNTGTLCNLTCRNCYIESSPKNDRLAYLSIAEVRDYLDEIAAEGLPVTE